MNLLPWRVRNFLSEHFPLLYHLVANLGKTGNSPAHWDARLAETWDAKGRNWPSLNDLVTTLTQPSEIILDVGCGNGGMLRHLKGRGYRNLHGMDISAYAVNRLSGEGIEMHLGKLPDIALPDACYDVVISSFVLEHVIRRGWFLKELRRVLKPGGRALLFVPDDCLGPIDESEHVIKFDARSLRKLLATRFAVLRLERVSDINNPMPILFAELRKQAG